MTIPTYSILAPIIYVSDRAIPSRSRSRNSPHVQIPAFPISLLSEATIYGYAPTSSGITFGWKYGSDYGWYGRNVVSNSAAVTGTW